MTSNSKEAKIICLMLIVCALFCLVCQITDGLIQDGTVAAKGDFGMERNTWPAGSDGKQIHEICMSPPGSQRRIRSIHSNVVGIARTHRYAACL